MNDISPPSRSFTDRGGSQSDLRRYNERVLLSVLDRDPGLFNAELARRTGLAAQTISVILRSLDSQGLIERGGVLRGRRGQPATPLFLKPDGAFGVGVALCWRRTMLCLSDLSGKVLAEDSFSHDHPGFDDTLERIVLAVDRLTAVLPKAARRRLAGLGLALPGAFDRYLAALDAPLEVVRDWAERDFGAELSQRIDMPVWPAGFGSAASGAEARAGQRTGGEFAYFFLGTLLMGGIVSAHGGFAAPGASGTMLGGMVVPGPDGLSVRADTVVSGVGLRRALNVHMASSWGDLGPEWDWHSYPRAVGAWLDEAAHVFAHLIVNTQCAFDPGAVVVDGFLPGDLIAALIARVEPVLAGLPSPLGRVPLIRQGRLGPRAAMAGAAHLPLHQQFFNIDPNG
ncbi:ROK family transcriptional regulator [Pelagibacterium limicola]|uniref:ROK family transcriptional regulator n=1 Tax=Pelagibacterium limicola TaxID=2791022 RepID=UPI0018AF7C51|nr:ROK family transcriptional regulator [Pelagibacterium limicola]